MTNPIAVMRLFRADRLRRQERERVVRPQGRSANDSKFDRDGMVFLVCAVLAYIAFFLAILGVI